MHYTRWYVNGDPNVVKKPHRVPVIDGKKRCASCGAQKPLTRFPPSARAKYGRGSHCYDCRSLKKRAAKYGISAERFLALIEEQDGVCDICKRKPEGKGFAVDHCHGSGAVRGLLCGPCNSAIGLLREDPEILRSAIRYLTKRA